MRFHAWTAELISHNHLDASGRLRVGQRIEIPVVTKARDKDAGAQGPGARTADKGNGGGSLGSSAGHPSRDRVRRTITRAANYRGVDPQLALAIGWQESGWQMHRVSSAGAIGAMQVLPGTGPLDGAVRRTRPAAAGSSRTTPPPGCCCSASSTTTPATAATRSAPTTRGSARCRSTACTTRPRRYVANVLAIKERLEAGRPPA